MADTQKNENDRASCLGTSLSRRDFLAAGLALGPAASMSAALAALGVAAPAVAGVAQPAAAVALNKINQHCS